MQLPAASPLEVRDVLDVAGLVSYLRSTSRTRPVAVLTVAPGQARPYANPSQLWKILDGLVDIVTIPTDSLTRAFSDQLTNERAATYRGGCRVYPPGTSWEDDPHSTRLRLTRDDTEIAGLQKGLIDDAHHVLRAPPPVPSPPRAAPVAPARPFTPGMMAGTPVRKVPVPGAVPRAVSNAGTLIPETLTTAADAQALARHLLDPARTRPVAVITRATGTPEPFVDVTDIRDNLVGLADVHEIATLDASWAFSTAVPDGCQVYGGASRVYPTGTDWLDDPYLSPLRFAFGAADGKRVSAQVIADAMQMAGGSLTLEPGAEESSQVTGTVQGIVGGSALVRLTDGQFGVVWPELVFTGTAAEALFAKGMRIEGLLAPEGRRIDVAEMRVPTNEALSGYCIGDTVLARVDGVARDGCTVALAPGVISRIPARLMSEETADPRTLVGVGDVIPVVVLGIGPWVLSLLDALEPADAVAAPALLRGGPPWLIPPTPESEPTEETLERAPTPAPPRPEVPDATLALRYELQQLRRELERAEGQVRHLDGQLRQSRLRLQEETRKRQRKSSRPVASEGIFGSDEEQLDHEVYLAWAEKIPAAEKTHRPLKRHLYGPNFFSTLRKMEGISRDKVVEVIVHILTGLDAELPSRELHQLRTGPGGDDPPRTRPDGATAWRVSMQINTPSARRLHYWRCPDGTIELSSVRLHDDMEP
jgi:hypothetical protein